MRRVIHVRGDASGLRDSRGGSVSILESGREPGTLGGVEGGEVCFIISRPRLRHVYVPLKGKTGEPKRFLGSPPRLRKPSGYRLSKLLTYPGCSLSLTVSQETLEDIVNSDAPWVPSKDKRTPGRLGDPAFGNHASLVT